MQYESVARAPSDGVNSAAKSPCAGWGRFFGPVDVAALVYFRIIFGAIMLWNAWMYCSKGWIEEDYLTPFHFTYYGFDWVRPWPGIGMYLHFYALGALAACLLLGLFYRISAILFFLGITYVFLLEQAVYQNHYYLVCLISLIMILQFSHFLARELKQQNPSHEIEIRVDVLAALNGGKPQLLIDPKVNLAAEPRTFGPKHWIMPLVEPVRDEP